MNIVIYQKRIFIGKYNIMDEILISTYSMHHFFTELLSSVKSSSFNSCTKCTLSEWNLWRFKTQHVENLHISWFAASFCNDVLGVLIIGRPDFKRFFTGPVSIKRFIVLVTADLVAGLRLGYVVLDKTRTSVWLRLLLPYHQDFYTYVRFL